MSSHGACSLRFLTWLANSAATSTPILPTHSRFVGNTQTSLAASVVTIWLRQATSSEPSQDCERATDKEGFGAMKPSVYMKRLQRVIATGGILTIAVSRSLAQAPQQIDHAAETKHFLNSARASGPPFAADLLLKFAAKNPRDPSTNSIIDEAFNAAIFSREAMPYTFGGTSLDTLPGKVALASQVGITRLSLQFRAVLLMLPLNPKAARDMFSEVRLPSMPSHACGDVLLYDLSGYHNALREIADFGFTQAEKAKELHLDLWRSQLESLTSIAQIEPLAMNLA